MPNSATGEPTALQFALALTITRSKPSNVSVRDYILTLRKHINQGKRPQFSATYDESQANYINAANYFESLLKEEQKTNEKLRNRVAFLERQCATADDFLSDSIDRRVDPKRPKKAVAKKKSRPAVKNDFSHLLEHLHQAQNIELDSPDGPGDTLLRHIYKLQASFQTTPRCPHSISRCLGQACAALPALLTSKYPRDDGVTPGHPDAEDENFWRALDRVLALVFHGFNILVSYSCESASSSATTNDSRVPLGPTIFSLLMVFQGILDILDAAADGYTKDPSPQPQQHRRSSASNPNSIAAATTASPPSHLHHTARFAQTFITLAIHHSANANLDANISPTNQRIQEAYAALLEGTLHVLLTRAGTYLYTAAFSAPRAATISTEIASTASSGQTFASGGASTTGPSSAARTAAERKGRALLPLLRLLVPRRHSSAPAAAGSPDNHRSGTDLIAKPLRALQNTLVRGVFGPADGEAACLGAHEFREALEMPARLAGGGIGDGVENGASEDAVDFAMGVWKIVGWDVLACGFGSGDGMRRGDGDCDDGVGWARLGRA